MSKDKRKYTTELSDSKLWKDTVKLTTTATRKTDIPYNVDPPKTFDGTTVWEPYTPPLPKQCQCGGSWAFAATMALNIRLRLWTQNQIRNLQGQQLELSVGKVLACNWGSIDEYNLIKEALQNLSTVEFESSEMYNKTPPVWCNRPETLLGGWQYLFRFGAFSVPCVTNDDFGVCAAVDAGNKGNINPDTECRVIVGPQFGHCKDGSPALTYKPGGFFTLPNDERVIRQELWKWGPVTTAFRVYPDFDAWDGKGIYTWDKQGKPLGGHAVVLMGWGVKNSVPYWIAMNWRGRDWGQGGYFYIRRGTDEVSIESNVVTGFPDLPLADDNMMWSSMAGEGDTFLANIWPIHSSGFKLSAIEEQLLKGRNVISERGGIDLYTESMIPDYKAMIAGQPDTIIFPHSRRILRQLPDVYIFIFAAVFMLITFAFVIALTSRQYDS